MIATRERTNHPRRQQDHVPGLHVRAITDEAVPIETQDDTRHEFCATGIAVQAATYIDEHIIGDFMSQTDVMTFLNDRFAGEASRDDC